MIDGGFAFVFALTAFVIFAIMYSNANETEEDKKENEKYKFDWGAFIIGMMAGASVLLVVLFFWTVSIIG